MLNRILVEIKRAAVNAMLPLIWVAAMLRYQLARKRGKDEKTLNEFHSSCAKIKASLFGYGKPKYKNISDLYTAKEVLFEHQHVSPALGQPSGVRVQDVIVVDNFYEDPDAVREYALGLKYEPYAIHRGKPFWFSSVLEVKKSPLNGKGIRLGNEQIKERLSEIIRTPIDDDTWETSGDGWNGAFHYKIRSHFPGATSQIHNHAGRESDVNEGWSGLVYLSEAPKTTAGTSIWREKKTGLCYSSDSVYTHDFDNYELILNVENRYNRLVLFYANVFHVGEEGFGNNINNARLFQTFFFNV